MNILKTTTQTVSASLNVVEATANATEMYVRGWAQRAEFAEKARLIEAESAARVRIATIRQSSIADLADEVERISSRIKSQEAYNNAAEMFDKVEL